MAIFGKKLEFSLESNLHGNNMIWYVSSWNKIQIKNYYQKVVITSVEFSCGGKGNKMVVIITQIYQVIKRVCWNISKYKFPTLASLLEEK